MSRQAGILGVIAGVLVFGSVGLAGPQVLEVSPNSLDFSAYAGGGNPAAQVLSIWNSGNGPMDWTVTPDCNWIAIEPNSGTSSGEVDDANVIVDINGLAEGTYSCHLTVTGSGAPNSPQIVDVNLVVNELVSWWEFEEGSGMTAYDSAGSNHGMLWGDRRWTTSGQIGGALDFDGWRDWVDCGNDASISGLSTFSVAVWFKTNVVPGSGTQPYLMAQQDLSATVWRFFLHGDYSGRLTGRIETSGTGAVGRSNFIPEVGEWYHAAMTYDNSGDRKVRVYVDGVEQSYDSQTAGTGTMSSNTSVKVAIGSRIGGMTGLDWDGTLDDVRVYNRVLSAGEILELAREGFGGRAFSPSPVGGATDVERDVVLSWLPGVYATSHDVYFGMDESDVNDASTSSAEFMGNQGANSWDPCGLEFSTTYYWRIDEVNGTDVDSPWKGDVWSFETGAPVIELSATQFNFFAADGGANPNDQILGISNAGTGTLNWEITEACDWLMVEPNSGSGMGEVDDVNLSVDITGIGGGVYNCSVTVSDPEAENNPQAVGVTLYVGDADGQLHVPSEYETIQEAIDIAVEGDTAIVEPGTYYENINFKGKNIILTSTDPNDWEVVEATVIDAGGSGSVVTFNGTENSNCVLRGFTITNGRKHNGGAGIAGNGTRAGISRCIISNNYASGGWTPVLIAGGMLECRGVISDCIITGNVADKGDGNAAAAGALHGCGSVTNCTITGNSVIGTSGIGGIYWSYGPITDCVISGNTGRTYGGIALVDESIINCLITGNTGEFGGGIYGCKGSEIRNCTVVGNTGRGVVRFTAGVMLRDCIIWGNIGEEVAGTSDIEYSCIEGWAGGGTGNISDDPCFVSGPLGDYYLSQIASGEGWDSPCVDSGNDTAANLGLDELTTRTDHWPDKGVVDMGYHYSIRAVSADADKNWFVDFVDFAILAGDWLECLDPCDINWLGGDISRDECVDGSDLWFIVAEWLECHVTAASGPSPADGYHFADPNGVLVWSAGDGAVYHDVYLGTDANAVGDANHLSAEFMGTVVDANFDPCGLGLSTTYYWRTGEVGPRCRAQQGDVWSFTTWAEPDIYLGLVSWWKFDEGAGSTAYDSAGDNNGILVGDPCWTSGQIDGALEFHGSRVDLQSPASLDNLPVGDLSVCAWIRDEYSAGTTWGTVFGAHDSIGWSLRTFSNASGDRSLIFRARHSTTGADYRSSDGTISTSTWHHVAGVWDASTNTAKLYIDGSEPSYQTSIGAVGAYYSDAAKDKEIGRLPHAGGTQYFNGKIDGVRIYDRPK